jgi:hypothetical protein
LALYAWTQPWLGTKGGLLAALVYTYLPWHLSTVYVRGAYAEAWLWAFWPLTLWAVDRLAERRPMSVLAGIAVGLPALAATFWTQPGLAALYTPLMVAYNMIHSPKRKDRILWLAGAMAMLSALLLMVALRSPEANASFHKGFVYPFQLLSAAWGDGLSFQLGLAAVGMNIVALALWLGKGREEAERLDFVDTDEIGTGLPAHFRSLGPALWFWLATLAIVILLILPLMSFLWRMVGLDRFLNQPWQLLALTGLPLAFLVGMAVNLDERLAELPALAGLAALVVLASYPYLAPRFTQVDPGPEPVALFQSAEADAAQVMILKHEISMPSEITPTLGLTLTWQTVAPLAQDYTAFVHVLAEDGTKIAQRDTQPCDGECPTSAWQPGEIVVDQIALDLSTEALPEAYQVAVGLYLLENGERAVVVGRDDGTVYFDVKEP